MEKKIDACFTKNSDDWATPTPIYRKFMFFGFYDPCPFKCDTNLYGKVLKNKRIYINPPFSQNKMWIKYAIDLSKDNDVWLLIAVRSDTSYFRSVVESCHPSIYFITGRISFNDKGHAPFPVMFLHLNETPFNFYTCMTQEEFIKRLDYLYAYI